jgi:uncharacterized surface protein with fasciclin (FAS1) repeats
MYAKFAVVATVLAATTAFGIEAQSSGKTDTKPATPPATAVADAKAPASIVKTAQEAGQFKVLCELLTAASLVDTLNGAGPFTVFAPTDAAFGKLPPETLAALKKDPKALGEILTYHVVAGNKGAAEVMKATELVTVQGQPIKITVKEGKVMLNNGATVTTADIKASNGVIHVIDTVITPPAKKDASSATGSKY